MNQKLSIQTFKNFSESLKKHLDDLAIKLDLLSKQSFNKIDKIIRVFDERIEKLQEQDNEQELQKYKDRVKALNRINRGFAKRIRNIRNLIFEAKDQFNEEHTYSLEFYTLLFTKVDKIIKKSNNEIRLLNKQINDVIKKQ